MFDLYSGEQKGPRKVAPVVVSVIGHLVMVTLVVIVPLLYATDTIPKLPSMMAFAADMPAPPPPPPPPPPPAPKPAAPKEAPQPAPNPLAAPVVAPSEIRPELPAPEVTRVERGVEGGVIGGIEGGIVTNLAPPPPPPPPPPAPKEPVRVGGNVQAPALVKRVEPTYPDLALVAKITGLVILEATVSTDGTVESVRVLRAVKFLDQAAIDAVKQWRYSPLVLNGVATPFVLSVSLNFSVKS